MKIDDEIQDVGSAFCFHLRPDGTYSRRWQWNNAIIEITSDPVKLFNRGPTTLVRYSENDGDEELMPENGQLHKDWEGYGIDFPMIIEKWLRRLNGEFIPLSDYYKNPLNRWADSL